MSGKSEIVYSWGYQERIHAQKTTGGKTATNPPSAPAPKQARARWPGRWAKFSGTKYKRKRRAKIRN